MSDRTPKEIDKALLDVEVHFAVRALVDHLNGFLASEQNWRDWVQSCNKIQRKAVLLALSSMAEVLIDEE